MTRKDFQLIAKVISAEGADGAKCHPIRARVLRDLAETFASELRATNPRFNRDRFLAACDLPEVTA